MAGYWAAGPPPGVAELFEAADRAGIDQIWTAEAYGSDAWTPLAWWGSRTSRIQLPCMDLAGWGGAADCRRCGTGPAGFPAGPALVMVSGLLVGVRRRGGWL